MKRYYIGKNELGFYRVGSKTKLKSLGITDISQLQGLVLETAIKLKELRAKKAKASNFNHVWDCAVDVRLLYDYLQDRVLQSDRYALFNARFV